MLLEKASIRIRCEMGACKELADYTIRLARVGIRSRIHMCKVCLQELGGLIEKEFAPESPPPVLPPPKSIETLKGKKKKEG